MRNRRPVWRRAARIAAAAVSLAVADAPAIAQPELDLNEMALRFTQGQYASPLTCEHAGAGRRGLRRVRIDAASKDLIPPSNHLVVYPMGIPEGVRCYLDTGETQVEVAGSVTYHLEGFSRPDLAPREFQETLQRDGGFTFTIKAGSLDVAGKRVDFKDGTARFTLVRPGTDPWKRLQDLDAPLKLTLSLDAPDGTHVAFDLAMTKPPGAPAKTR